MILKRWSAGRPGTMKTRDSSESGCMKRKRITFVANQLGRIQCDVILSAGKAGTKDLYVSVILKR